MTFCPTLCLVCCIFYAGFFQFLLDHFVPLTLFLFIEGRFWDSPINKTIMVVIKWESLAQLLPNNKVQGTNLRAFIYVSTRCSCACVSFFQVLWIPPTFQKTCAFGWVCTLNLPGLECVRECKECVSWTAALRTLMRYKWWLTENGLVEVQMNWWMDNTNHIRIHSLSYQPQPSWLGKGSHYGICQEVVLWNKTFHFCLMSAFHQVAFNNVSFIQNKKGCSLERLKKNSWSQYKKTFVEVYTLITKLRWKVRLGGPGQLKLSDACRAILNSIKSLNDHLCWSVVSFEEYTGDLLSLTGTEAVFNQAWHRF